MGIFLWIYTSAGLAQHALNVLNGESELDDIDDIAKAYQVFSPKLSGMVPITPMWKPALS